MKVCQIVSMAKERHRQSSSSDSKTHGQKWHLHQLYCQSIQSILKRVLLWVCITYAAQL